MPVRVDQLNTEVVTTAPEPEPSSPRGDPRWTRDDRAREERRDERWRNRRTRAEGLDD